MTYEETIAEWQTLSDKIKGIKTSYGNLVDRKEQIQDKAHKFKDDLFDVNNEIEQGSAAVLTGLQEAVTQFEGLPSRVQDALESFDGPAGEACLKFCEEGKNVLEDSSEKVQSSLKELGEVSKGLVESQDEFLKEEVLNSLESKFEELLTDLIEFGGEKREKLTSAIEEMSEKELELGNALSEKLDSYVEEWKEKIEEIVGSYTEVGERVESLGNDVETMTTAVEDALSLTSVGMSAATSSIDDIKAVMTSVV